MLNEELHRIASQFQVRGEILRIEKFGAGLINETYRSIVENEEAILSYVHQKINQHVFPRPDYVIENMLLVTRHVREKQLQQHAHARKTTLELIPAQDGQFYYIDNAGEYWRTTVLIPDIMAYDTVQSPQHACEAGRVLGEFQAFVSDIPPEDLHDTLPGYHYTPRYYENFLRALRDSHSEPQIESRKRESEVIELVEHITCREALGSLLMSALQEGRLTERVVHNDPKINNILLDAETQHGVCIIDLDTVKSGLIHFDYGDCLRTVANPLGEETRNIRGVYFDLKNFEALSKGYLEETRSFLTETDVDYLIDSIKVIVFEQTIRFLSDYLQGDIYYTPTDYPTQNLNRALVQFALLRDLEKKEVEARKVLKRLFN